MFDNDDDFSDPMRDRPKIVEVSKGKVTFKIQPFGQYGFFKVTQDKAKVQPITGMFTTLDDAKKAINSYFASVSAD